MNIDVNELEVMEDIASLAVVTGEKKEKTQAKIYQSSVRYGADRPARYQSFFV